MTKAIQIHAHGGPEVLKLVDLKLPRPGKGEVQVAIKAIGMNFIDIYQRSGLYPQVLPFVPGNVR
jgi:NADPH2:quinone reductase